MILSNSFSWKNSTCCNFSSKGTPDYGMWVVIAGKRRCHCVHLWFLAGKNDPCIQGVTIWFLTMNHPDHHSDGKVPKLGGGGSSHLQSSSRLRSKSPNSVTQGSRQGGEHSACMSDMLGDNESFRICLCHVDDSRWVISCHVSLF